jgi:hypothetical protein
MEAQMRRVGPGGGVERWLLLALLLAGSTLRAEGGLREPLPRPRAPRRAAPPAAPLVSAAR